MAVSIQTQESTPRRLCFVTVGATANFNPLIRAVLHATFLLSLAKAGYTDLLIQHGKDGEFLLDELAPKQVSGGTESAVRSANGIRIDGFDFRKEGLGKEFIAARGSAGGFHAEGVCISHAGSGSILDALRLSIPLIVVPNPTLLDNHQDELAEELARQGYVVHGKLSTTPGDDAGSAASLAKAIEESEILKKEHQQWPPVNSGELDPQQERGLHGVMDEEMGYLQIE